MHSSVMRLPTCSVRCPTTHHPIVLCTAPLWAWPPTRSTPPQRTWPRAVYGLAAQSSRLVECRAPSGTCQLVPCAGPPHTSLLSVTRPLRERLRSFRARSRRTFAGLFRVRPRRALPYCPLHGTRFSARPMHSLAWHVQAASGHGPAVSQPSSSVYGPAVHFSPGMCTALPSNHHASLSAHLRRALANLFRVRASRTLPSCQLHGPSVSVSRRSMHGSAVHMRVCSVCGPAAH